MKKSNLISGIRKNDWKKLIFELLVVFLGVTAGFLLNNWQLDQQDQALEKKYLNGFLEDVSANIAELQNTVETDSLRLNRINPLLLSIRSLPLDSANSVARLIVHLSRLELRKNTYENITNSGNLGIIRDFALKEALVDYYVACDGLAFVEDYFARYFNDYVMPFIFKNFDILRGEFRSANSLKTIRFSNVVAGYYSMVQQRKVACEDLLEKSRALREQLQLENFPD